ncbi:Smr/MutS family protein [Pelagibacterium montanilacus]|uniref:Smr/MutS family protein n=1 Tax=Pelagibacterium montanilacus TaxID=2185280 RepID=UPI000F8CB9F9|nr:Smr/MutS family protein [Pelagibacterium montanilacus]
MQRKPKQGRAGGLSPGDITIWDAVGRTVDPLSRRKTADPRAFLEKLGDPAPAPLAGKRGASVTPSPAPFNPPPAPRGPRRDPAKRAIEPGLRRRVEKGRVPIDATLDLHGMTQDRARARLERFVHDTVGRGYRTVLVITGKGLKKTGYLQIERQGVLRTMVPIWLTDPGLSALVSGWEPAHVGHGGEGALYVRLKRRRDERW